MVAFWPHTLWLPTHFAYAEFHFYLHFPPAGAKTEHWGWVLDAEQGELLQVEVCAAAQCGDRPSTALHWAFSASTGLQGHLCPVLLPSQGA